MSDEKVELGKKLFWDGRLSGDGSTACVACHMPQMGWAFTSPISRGYPGTVHWRFSQTVLNSGYYTKLFWEGNVNSLEQQAKAAATGAVAGNGDESMMEMQLRFVPEYVEDFQNIFGTPWPNIEDAWKAIAAFQRTLVSDPDKVPFDRYMNGDESALSESQLRGMELFEGKANCVACHSGPLLSDQSFHALGVPNNSLFESEPLYQISHRWQQYQKGVSEDVYRTANEDMGLYYGTKDPENKGKFRTPSLRELKYTAPYMHNGTLATLADVIDFYDAGGGEHPNKSSLMQPLGLDEKEREDLVAFLEALSMDEPLLMDSPALPASVPLQ
ncbi:cytochrome-c peroxidase [Halomonas alkalisoli]|uniref:cytochrome-c peroxidase n=1 Tax=Halomonas alkalisoli TaxID=2907158 RepID=UPI001F1AAFFB|nr:cytochrome c peroxidase [Halomonas alkalisoli]MCE9682500.1 c-type cytochrome [Halomonas alkalisoli]